MSVGEGTCELLKILYFFLLWIFFLIFHDFLVAEFVNSLEKLKTVTIEESGVAWRCWPPVPNTSAAWAFAQTIWVWRESRFKTCHDFWRWWWRRLSDFWGLLAVAAVLADYFHWLRFSFLISILLAEIELKRTIWFFFLFRCSIRPSACPSVRLVFKV